MLESSAVTAIVGVATAGALSQYLAWRIKVPAILFLLLAGILAGPVSGLLDPDALFGDLLFPFISLAVAVKKTTVGASHSLENKLSGSHGGVFVLRLIENACTA